MELTPTFWLLDIYYISKGGFPIPMTGGINSIEIDRIALGQDNNFLY